MTENGDLTNELNQTAKADFEKEAGKDTSTESTRHFSDADEQKAIADAAKAVQEKNKNKGK